LQFFAENFSVGVNFSAEGENVRGRLGHAYEKTTMIICQPPPKISAANLFLPTKLIFSQLRGNCGPFIVY